MASSKSASKSKKSNRTFAEQADKFRCYQQSVQSPEHEIEFFEQAYRDEFKRKPYLLREDFCGTFAVCCEWVKANSRRTAIGVDLCLKQRVFPRFDLTYVDSLLVILKEVKLSLFCRCVEVLFFQCRVIFEF